MKVLSVLLVTGMVLGLGVGLSLAAEKDILVVDRFIDGVNEEGLPKGWTQEKTMSSESRISLEKEKETHYLRLLSVRDSFGLKRGISFDIRKYPYLTWRWRAVKLPPRGDIRKRETDDQAGQMYVVFPKFPTMINTRSLGYIWDTHAPAGYSGTSTAYSKMKYVVLQSGASRLNQWISEMRNVYEDYKSFFKEEPPAVGAILLYINSQHTQSSAEIHYGEIFFSSRPPKDMKE